MSTNTTNTTTATSTQAVITAVVANGVICAVFVLGFFLLRLKFNRIYQPKSTLNIIPENDRPEPLPKYPWLWLTTLLHKKPAFIIQHAGLDGYLFIRYLFIITCFGLGGMLTWIILFPVNATNGKGGTGLDQLGISNVGNVGRYYAHVFISWIFYGCIMFVIYRELQFYTNLRALALTTPKYAKKLSSRTVIFQTVPDQYLDEIEFFKLFEGVRKVWVARGQKKLAKKVKERENLCATLEGAINSLLSKAMKAKLKADKKGEPIEPANEIVCYVPQKKRPTMRLKKFIGKKVDVIDHCKEKIPEINDEIEKLQSEFKNSEPMNSIAVEFENQYYAQLAYQTTIHDQPLQFSPKHIGVNPEDIFWPNMRIFWWEALARRFGATSLIIFVIIIWAIPVAFVGFISNITYLTNKMPWLNFIYHLPTQLLGLITSLLPTVLLALLMMLLPIFIMTMAKVSGCLTVQSVQYYTQNAYFAFQVIQVFLVVTIASSVSSVATQIIEKPTSAMSVLSENLPKSSNFFISYIILQGLSVSGGSLFQIVPLILFYVLSFALDKTPRKKYNRWSSLGSYSWGTMFPTYTNLAVISITYAIISPIILLFTFVGFLLLFICYLNNATYVTGKGPDSIGIHYPRALFQLMVGIYLGEVCLLGLFAVSKSWGCIVLEAVFIGATVFFHVQMNAAFNELVTIVPNTCMRPLDGFSETLSWKNPTQTETNDHHDIKSPFMTMDELKEIEGERRKQESDFKKDDSAMEDLANVPLLVDGDRSSLSKPSFILRFLQPWKYLTFHDLKEYIPATFYDYPDEDPEANAHAFDYPDVTAKCPIIWIPKDPVGLSTVEIENLKGVIEVSDEASYFDEKGKIIFTGPPPSYDDISINKDLDDKKLFTTASSLNEQNKDFDNTYIENQSTSYPVEKDDN